MFHRDGVKHTDFRAFKLADCAKHTENFQVMLFFDNFFKNWFKL